MVLASTNDSVPLDKLAQLADKIVKVAVPQTVSAVQSANLGDELDKLKSEVAGLRKLIKSIPSQCNSHPRSPSLAWQTTSMILVFAGTTKNMDHQLIGLNLLVSTLMTPHPV